MATPESVSFIVPVKNGARYIESCLDHIEAVMAPGDDITVVDNGSTDNTVALVRSHPKVRLLEHPEISIGALRNRGAQTSQADFLAFADSDVLLLPGWRAGMIETMSDPKVHATGSLCELPPSPTWVERAWLTSRKRVAKAVEYLPSGNLIIRRDVFETLEGFDETLITDEDYDIGQRIVRAGGIVMDSPPVRSIHLGNSKTIAQYIQRQKWHAVSILDTLAKDGWDKPMIMTVLFMATAVMALASLIAYFLVGPYALIGVATILIAPLVTAAHRIARNGRWRYFPHLLLLYSLFHWARSEVLLKTILSRRSSSDDGAA